MIAGKEMFSFSSCRKDDSDYAETTSSGRLHSSRYMAQQLTVSVSSIRRSLPAERSASRPGISATWTSGRSYRFIIHQHCHLVLDTVLKLATSRADEGISDVVELRQAIDQLCRRIQHPATTMP